MSFGIALAKIKSKRGKELRAGKSEEGKMLQHFYILREDLQKTPDRVRQVLLEGIPNSRCNPESCLAQNEEFFTAYLLEYNLKKEHKQHCNKLSSHLNDCFQCFQNYSDIVRDFLHNQ